MAIYSEHVIYKDIKLIYIYTYTHKLIPYRRVRQQITTQYNENNLQFLTETDIFLEHVFMSGFTHL